MFGRSDKPLLPYELEGLAFVHREGSHCIGIIDDVDKMAAACVFHSLTEKGYLMGIKGARGPTYHSTAKGLDALKKAGLV